MPNTSADELRTSRPLARLQIDLANTALPPQSSDGSSPSPSSASSSSSTMMAYAPRYASPLSSPSLSASSSSSAGAFPAPSVAMSASSSASSYGTDLQRNVLVGPSSSARRSSSPCFPRSQPLRPLSSGLCMSSLNSPAARRKSEGAVEPRPINYMMQPSRGNGKKVKMLVSSKKMNCFELNLSGRELARAE